MNSQEDSDTAGLEKNRLNILVVCPDSPSAPQFGPNIRSMAIARQLAREFRVTLALRSPEKGTRGQAPELEGIESFWWDRSSIGRQMKSFDVVISQGLQLPARVMSFSRALQVVDLCTPVVLEQLGGGQARPGELGHLQRLTRFLLRRGDYFLCACPQQRDLWLGALYASRPVATGPESDQALRRLVGIVPFGHDGSLPQRTRPALKGVVPGIDSNDHVLLWGGGVWNWFDPLTLISAMGEIALERRDVKLFFLGSRFPNRRFEDYAMLDRARKLAGKLGILGKNVFFHEGCVSFDERANYLLDSDLAVCTAPDTLENRFSFRTRLVDALWAGVPVVCTQGGVMGDYVDQNAIGYTVRHGDPKQLKQAILEALKPQVQGRFRANLAACRNELRWERCVRPLVEFCRNAQPLPRSASSGFYAKALGEYLRYKTPSLTQKALAMFRRRGHA